MSSDRPDPRFSLANERTFLAWVRTALGLLAAAAALLAVDLPWPAWVVTGLAVILALVAALAAALGWSRWRRVEAAIQEGIAAPAPRGHVILPAAVVLVAVVVVALAATTGW